jgi:hypothetical protein
VRIQPDSSAVMIEEMAMFIIPNPYALARSAAVVDHNRSQRCSRQPPEVKREPDARNGVARSRRGEAAKASDPAGRSAYC